MALISFTNRLNGQDASRRQAREDSCYLIRGLALDTAQSAAHKKLVRAYLNRSVLASCVRYAHSP